MGLGKSILHRISECVDNNWKRVMFVKGETEITWVQALGAIAVVAILIYGASLFNIRLFPASQATFNTYTITSMSAVNILSNPANLGLPSGEYWLINLNTQTQSGYDQIYGESAAGNLSLSGWKSGEGIRVKMERTQATSCNYDLVQQQGTDNYGYQIAYMPYLAVYRQGFGQILLQGERQTAAQNWCYGSGLGGQCLQCTNYNSIYGCLDYACVKEDVRGVKGVQSTQTYLDWGEKFTVERLNGGFSSTATINRSSTSNLLTLYNGDVVGKVAWQGNLLGSNLACDYSLNQYTPIFSKQSNTWLIADAGSVQSYSSLIQPFRVSCGKYASDTEFTNAVNAINNQLSVAIKPTQNPPFNQVSFAKPTATSATATIIPSGVPVLPQISLYLSTVVVPKIAIVLEGSTPKVTQANDVSFITTKTGSGSGQVQNVGAGNGNFQMTISCPSFTSSISPQLVSALAPNGISSIFYTVTGVCSSSRSETCTITAKDVNTMQTSSKTFNANCAPLCTKTCLANTHLDPTTCNCICDLTGTIHWNADATACSNTCFPPQTPCQYGQNSVTCQCNPPSNCNLACTSPYVANQACNACTCGLDPNGAPNGQHLDSAQCKYVANEGTTGCPTGKQQCIFGGCDTEQGCQDQLIGGLILIVVVLAIVAFAIMYLGEDKKSG